MRKIIGKNLTIEEEKEMLRKLGVGEEEIEKVREPITHTLKI